LPKNRNTVLLLAFAGVVVIGIAVYALFFAGTGCENCPTFKYFRLET